jgi:hypothetical protein
MLQKHNSDRYGFNVSRLLNKFIMKKNLLLELCDLLKFEKFAFTNMSSVQGGQGTDTFTRSDYTLTVESDRDSIPAVDPDDDGPIIIEILP